MKKNLLFTLIIPMIFSFCIIKPMQEQPENNLKTLAGDITIAMAVGIVSGELWAQLDTNECDETPSTRHIVGRIAIDAPLASILNAYNTNSRKALLINSTYFISSTLSYYASSYVHNAFQSALGQG